ncbi:MAG: hypothetical protein KBF88_12905 [Polyangiaceae bacterium]|nr:hypothetical protein [Polyangiaceae bacterium]
MGAVASVACGSNVEYVFVPIPVPGTTIIQPPAGPGEADASTPNETVVSPTTCGWDREDDGLIGINATDVVFDKRVPGRVWLAAGKSMLRSDDHGKTFQEVGEVGAAVTDIAIPALNPLELFVSTSDGVFRSTDGGQRWFRTSLGGTNVSKLAIDPKDNRRLFAAVPFSNVLMSVDGGITFRPYNKNLPRLEVISLDVHPARDELILLASNLDAPIGPTRHSIYRTEAGDDWKRIRDYESGFTLERCGANPDDLFFAAVNGGLQHSTDSGKTWATISTEVVNSVWVAPSNCKQLYPSGLWGTGTFRSFDGGLTRVGPFKTGFPFAVKQAWTAAIDPENPNTLVGISHGVVVHTSNAGDLWTPVIMDARPAASSLTTSKDGTQWLSTWGSHQWMREPGKPWAMLMDSEQFGFTSQPFPQAPHKALFGVWSETVVYDGSQRSVISPRIVSNPMSFAFSPADPSTVVLGTQLDGVHISRDGGTSWSKKSTGIVPNEYGTMDIRAVAFLSADRILAGSNDKGLFLSKDKGENWTAVADPALGASVVRLVETPGAVIAVVPTRGLFRSTDGERWVRIDEGISTLNVADVIAEGTTLYASYEAGLYSSSSGGAWKAFGGQCIRGVGKLTISTRNGSKRLYATAVDGIYSIAL